VCEGYVKVFGRRSGRCGVCEEEEVRTENRLSRCVEVMFLHDPPVDLDHHQLGEEEGVGGGQRVFARVRVALCCVIFLLKCSLRDAIPWRRQN
jgi:hypothetical protein